MTAYAAALYMIVSSTSYCGFGTMADGTRTRHGSVAMNNVRMHSKVKLARRTFFGRKHFVVRDRIGYGSQLDFWTPDCSKSLRWGRRTVKIRLEAP